MEIERIGSGGRHAGQPGRQIIRKLALEFKRLTKFFLSLQSHKNIMLQVDLPVVPAALFQCLSRLSAIDAGAGENFGELIYK